jgi:low affinity Fe/Cu permease
MADAPQGTREHVEDAFARLAGRVAVATGSFWAFSVALFVILMWALSGPLFGFSNTWQLVINSSTTIVTCLMVFVIQHAQNKDMRAVQLKLNELIAAVAGASNRLIDVEDLSDRELQHLYARYRHLAETAASLQPGASTSVDSDDEKAGKQDAPTEKPAHA